MAARAEIDFCRMPHEKPNIFPFALARVCGLPVVLLDELAVTDPFVFEKTVGDPQLLRGEWLRVFEKMQAASHLAPLERSLLFASHDLLDRLPKFRETTAQNFVKKQRQTALGLYEYLARAASKTSPFAQLCSVQLVDSQPVETDFSFLESLAENPRWAGQPVHARGGAKLRHTLNVALLERIIDRLSGDDNFARQLETRLNPTLSQLPGGAARFLFFDNENEAFQHLENEEVARAALDFFAQKTTDKPRPETLGNFLAERFELTAEGAQLVENQLVAIGFLERLPPVSGHEPDWASRFLNRLAFFQKFEKQDELAALFHWLNGTAKQLGWLPVAEAQAAQVEASRRLFAFLGENFGGAKAVPPEQIWFEDAATEHELGFAFEEVEQLTGSVRAAVLEAGGFPASGLLARAAGFFEKEFGAREAGFLDFAEAFFKTGRPQTADGPIFFPVQKGQKTGATLQVFFDETGKAGAVVNSLFPGGGRVFARFAPLFPEKLADAIKIWNGPRPGFPALTVGFYGQAYHNANLSPILADLELDFHGSRPRLPGEKRVGLAEITVRLDENSGLPRAFLPKKESWLALADLGLEAPGSRTPVLQLLKALSQPPISLAGLVDFYSKKEGGKSGHLPRLTVGEGLILRRETWVFDAEEMPRRTRKTEPGTVWLSQIIAFQKREGLPRRCFFSTGGKPQFVDFQSVISLRAFQIRLEKAEGEVVFTEMLPLPEHLPAGRAVEVVVEFEV